MFGVLPATLLKLPLSEFRIMRRYYERVREETENLAAGREPSDGTIVE